MTEIPVIRALARAAIKVQLPIVLVAIPVTAALIGIAFAPLAVDVVRDAKHSDAHRAAVSAVAVVISMMVVGVIISTFGAAMVLRGSIRAAVDQMQQATQAIARGDFRHRVNSKRTDELGGLGMSIDVMAHRLESLEQVRRQFLACVSHELRTPLTVIRGHSYSAWRHADNPRDRERLQVVQDETVVLAELINDLVDASALHAGAVRLTLERVDLVEVVDAVARRFHEHAHTADLTLEIEAGDDSVFVDADPTRLGQMLGNVLMNAIRHAASRSTITIRLATCSNVASVSVHNVGSPISTELQDTIFEPFVQGESRTGRVGLGLAITSALAAAQDGTIVLTDAGHTSGVVCFRIDLPIAQYAPAAVSRAGVVASSIPRLGSMETAPA